MIELLPADRRAQGADVARRRLCAASSPRCCCGSVTGGRIAAREILLNTPAVVDPVLEGKMFQLPVALDSGRRHGMVPLTDSLAALRARRDRPRGRGVPEGARSRGARGRAQARRCRYVVCRAPGVTAQEQLTPEVDVPESPATRARGAIEARAAIDAVGASRRAPTPPSRAYEQFLTAQAVPAFHHFAGGTRRRGASLQGLHAGRLGAPVVRKRRRRLHRAVARHDRRSARRSSAARAVGRGRRPSRRSVRSATAPRSSRSLTEERRCSSFAASSEIRPRGQPSSGQSPAEAGLDRTARDARRLAISSSPRSTTAESGPCAARALAARSALRPGVSDSLIGTPSTRSAPSVGVLDRRRSSPAPASCGSLSTSPTSRTEPHGTPAASSSREPLVARTACAVARASSGLSIVVVRDAIAVGQRTADRPRVPPAPPRRRTRRHCSSLPTAITKSPSAAANVSYGTIVGCRLPEPLAAIAPVAK